MGAICAVLLAFTFQAPADAEPSAALCILGYGELGSNATGHVSELVVEPVAVFRDGTWMSPDDPEKGVEPGEADPFWSVAMGSPYFEIRTGEPVFEVAESAPRLGWGESSFQGVRGRFLPEGKEPTAAQWRGYSTSEWGGLVVCNGARTLIAPPPPHIPPTAAFFALVKEGIGREVQGALERVTLARTYSLNEIGLYEADIASAAADDLHLTAPPKVTLVRPVALHPDRRAFWVEGEAAFEDTWADRPKDGDSAWFEWYVRYFAVVEMVDGSPVTRWASSKSMPGDRDVDNGSNFAFLGTADLNPDTPYEVVVQEFGHEEWQYIVLDWEGDALNPVAASGWDSP